MNRFFIDKEQFNKEKVEIIGEDYIHIKDVLRMKVGEKVLLCDGSDREYEAEIIGFNDGAKREERSVLLKIVDMFGKSRELPCKITLFQGYPKGDKMEQIVQKAVELGVYEVVPVMMNRCVVKLDEKKAVKKVERLNTIAMNAAKQSQRGIIPKVTKAVDIDDAITVAKDLDYVIIPYECAEGMEYSRKVIKEAIDKNSVGVFIGPEGGFDTNEIDILKSIGGKVISLGNRILRTETAGMTMLSILMYLMEK